MSGEASRRLARRGLFRGAAGLGAAAAVPLGAPAQTPPAEGPPAGQPPAGAPPAPAAAPAGPQPGTLAAWRAGDRAAPRPAQPYRFLNAAEAAFVEAAVDRLIPEDEDWPGALWAGVPAYIDGQLAGAYGGGARFFAAGPWKRGVPSQGYQLPLNPSQLYRTALAAILKEAERRNLDFAGAPPEARDGFLQEIEAGTIDCGGFPSSFFFETFLANAIEGFLADPGYGGNRDMVGWRMIGFPGAYAAYSQLYWRHGMTLDREPLAMGEAAAHHHERSEEQEHGGHPHG